MPLGKKKTSVNSSRSDGAKKKHTYVSVGSIWASDFDAKDGQPGLDITIRHDATKDKYAKGELIFRRFADAETGTNEEYYKVKRVYAFTPNADKSPAKLLYNLSIALTNDKSTELLAEESAEDSE